MDYNKKLKDIIHYYGVKPQLKHFHSEVYELIESIIDYYDYSLYAPHGALKEGWDRFFKEHITEEIADVQVMLNQFKLGLDIKEEDILNVMKKKIERQTQRIEEEVYERTRHTKEDN